MTSDKNRYLPMFMRREIREQQRISDKNTQKRRKANKAAGQARRRK